MSKASEKPSLNLLDAARSCDSLVVKDRISQGADVNMSDKNGFNALHYAAMGSNACDEETPILKTLKVLLEAGCPLTSVSNDGRSPLFLLAEFSPFLSPVAFLIQAGADPDVRDGHGNHITENAMMEEVQALLSELTGVVPQEPEPELHSEKMSPLAWKTASKTVDDVFSELNADGIICLADTGYTQSDGFADCAEVLAKHSQPDRVSGFCFYTRQDLRTAKQTSQLYLGIWGAPSGGDQETITVAKSVISAFQNHGMSCSWNGSASVRPCVLLYDFKG